MIRMTLNELYKIADDNNIELYYFPFESLISVSIPSGFIGIDTNSLKTTSDERTILAHELGHQITGSFYTGSSPYDLRSRKEFKANKWAVNTLIPYDELIDAFENGILERWELAEYFGVTEDMIDMAFKLYEDKLICNKRKKEFL